MKRNCLLALVSLFFFSLTSCVKDSSDITLQHTPRLVVECYLNPTDPEISALVNENRPIDGEGSANRGDRNPVLNATVLLSDGTRQVQLVNSKTNTYRIASSSFKLVAGRSYTLKVSAPGLPAVEASCTIPQVMGTLSAQDQGLRYEQSQPSSYNVYRQRRLSWSNAENKKGTQYYLVGSGEGSAYQVKAAAGDSTCIQIKNAQVVAFLDDSQASGATFSTQTLSFLVGQTRSTTDPNITSAAPRYSFVYHVDKNYYEFYKSVKRQREVGDNPFAEAMPVYTNLQNGLGVFAAYVTQVKRL